MSKVGIVAVLLALSGILGAQDLPDWQLKAGGKASFEVASVKRFKPSPGQIPRLPNMGLNTGDAKPAGGRFVAALPVQAYITFAYKLDAVESQDAFSHLPAWVRTDSFEVDARAPGNPTKDQMRLMMQSLLADRFKVAVHSETREVPVLVSCILN